MHDERAERLIRECLAADERARRTRAKADDLLSSFRAQARADVAEAVRRFNAEADGPYLYDTHDTKVVIAETAGRTFVEVTVTLGYFRTRDGATLRPREAWGLDEERLTGALKAYLAATLGWASRCTVNVHPPLDYDMMSADPEL